MGTVYPVVAPFVVSFFWGANLHCFLLLVCHLWFLGTQEKNRQAVSLSGACQDPNASFLYFLKNKKRNCINNVPGNKRLSGHMVSFFSFLLGGEKRCATKLKKEEKKSRAREQLSGSISFLFLFAAAN